MPEPTQRSGWTLAEALSFCRSLAEYLKPKGYYVGLAGSVLTRGRSRKDLDIVVYPESAPAHEAAALRDHLRAFGLKLRVPVENVHLRWRKLGSVDTKHVEVWYFDRKRVDIFTLM
jgi:hypothetical protein